MNVGRLLIIKKKYKIFKHQKTKYVYRKELDKACFQNDMVYNAYEDLAGRTAIDQVLLDKAFESASNPKCGGNQRGFASMIYKFFDKKSLSENIIKTRVATCADTATLNQQLDDKLHNY